MAVLHPLQFATDMGISKIELETDAINLQVAMTSSRMDQSTNGVLFRDIKFLMYNKFVLVQVLHNPRSCNVLADGLAKLGVELGPSAVQIWSDSYHQRVNRLVAADKSSASG